MTPPAAPETPTRADADCRCVCGSLVARLVDEGVELKCRRCKRTLIVPLSRSVPSAAASHRAGAGAAREAG